MLVKKLAVPLINEKILNQAEACYIATHAISEAGFDFIRTRLPLKSKMTIVTGLDGLTSPAVLRKTWRNYHDRITIKIYTRNVFNANVYIFDLPFRKGVAFTGSGNLTLGGLKDHEEVFDKVTDAKEIEALISWYTGYYEFAEQLTEEMLLEYERIYPFLKQREIASRKQKEEFIALTGRGFNWESIRFKTQFFKKEDYQVLANEKASLNSDEVKAERSAVQMKLRSLEDSLKGALGDLGLRENPDAAAISTNVGDRSDRQIREMAFSFGRSKTTNEFARVEISLRPISIRVALVLGHGGEGREDREYLRKKIEETEFRPVFFKALQNLGAGYWIEVEGEQRAVETFQNDETLAEFVKADDWRYFSMVIARNYKPGDTDVSQELIAATLKKEAEKLVKVYDLINDGRKKSS